MNNLKKWESLQSLVAQWQSWYFMSHFTISVLFENNVVASHILVDLQSHLDILNLGNTALCPYKKTSGTTAKNSYVDNF